MIAKLFVRPSRRDRRAGRLGVERLEGRDVPAVTFTVETLSDTTEGGSAGTFRVTATGDPSDFTPYQVVAVWSGTGGTATYNTDYTASPGLAGYLNFPSSGSQATVTITPTDDSTFEGDETLELRIQRYQMFPTGPVVTGTMTIHDNEPPAVVSVERVADAVEGGADGTFRFTRTGGNLSQSLTVSYTVETTGTGAATPTTDYTALSGTVTFAANAATADVTVDASTDGLIEDGEWVALAIDQDSDYEIGWADGAAVFIRDQTREVSVAGIQDAEEGGADGTLRFTRTGDLSEALTVTYTVATTGPSLATPTADYTALTGSVTFAAYSATADASVVTADDGVQEPDEVVIVTIAAASTYTIGTATGQVWIEDDDGGSMYWISADDGHWRDPSNWSLNREPVSGDHLYFTGDYNGNMTGFDTHTGTLTYAGLHVLDSHTGTITLTLPVTFGTVEMHAEDAVIDQPEGEGSVLTITSHFDWTGGTINESETASTIVLDSAVGLLAPDGGETVWTGSNINLVGGTVLTALSGTLQMLNDDLEIDVEEYCGLAIDPGEGGPVFIVEGAENTYNKPLLRLGANAWAEVQSGSAWWFGRITNANGRLTLLEYTSLHINGTEDIERAYVQWNGVTELYYGSMLSTGSGKEVYIQGGAFYVKTSSPFADATVATTLFTFKGANLSIGEGGNAHAYGTFTVIGNVLWLEGATYTAYVEGDSAQGQADQWIIRGELECAGGALNTVVLDSEGQPVTPTSEGQWSVVEGEKLIKTNLTYDTNLWSLNEVGAPAIVTRWVLTPK